MIFFFLRDRQSVLGGGGLAAGKTETQKHLAHWLSWTEFHPINYLVKCPIGKGLNE